MKLHHLFLDVRGAFKSFDAGLINSGDLIRNLREALQLREAEAGSPEPPHPLLREATTEQLLDELEGRHYASIVWLFKAVLSKPAVACDEVLSFKGPSTLTRGAVSVIADRARAREGQPGFRRRDNGPAEDR